MPLKIFKMFKYMVKIKITAIFFGLIGLLNFPVHAQEITNIIITSEDIRTGAERTNLYFPLLKGKNVAVVANQTSMVGKTNLVDTLLNSGIKVVKVFCPEHGFRGEKNAGEHFASYIDEKTKLPVISLYGKNKKPKKTDMKDVNVVLFDLQDVGVRFYTYISTMHYVMEACAENNVEFIVLDRPNPNGYYVDGPVLEEKYKSFVGMNLVPIVHGMTVAEYACMINGEGWLKNGIKCNLKYVTVDNYNHTYLYVLPVKPSPNLSNMNAVYLYPSLCLFEGTVVSVGRGTDKPFQMIGHPQLTNTSISFTPNSIEGVCTDPLYKGIQCNGYDLSEFVDVYLKNSRKLYLFWLMETYKQLKDKTQFFNSYFDNLAGNATLRQQIMQGMSEEDIHKSWESGISKFKKIRKKYLLYPDFE